jgi:hypothetical protein
MTARLADDGAKYQIRVHGRLDPLWAARLGNLTLTVHDAGGQSAAVTDLTGWVTDQAALMGVFQLLYALGVTVLSVERLEEDGSGNESGATQ